MNKKKKTNSISVSKSAESLAKVIAVAALVPTAYAISQNVIHADDGEETTDTPQGKELITLDTKFVQVHFGNGKATDDAGTRKTSNITLTGSYDKDTVTKLFVSLKDASNGLDIISGTKDSPVQNASKTIEGYVDAENELWSITFNFQDLAVGTYDATIVANDNEDKKLTAQVNVTNTKPVVNILSNYLIAATNTPSTLDIEGSIYDLDGDTIKSIKISVEDEDGAEITTTNANIEANVWTATIDCTGLSPNKKYTIKAVANDYIEDSNTDSVDLFVSDPPTCTINPIEESLKYSTSSQKISVSGTASAANGKTFSLYVRFNGGEYKEVTVNSDGTWQTEIDIAAGLAGGRYYIEAYVEDEICESKVVSEEIYIVQNKQPIVKLDKTEIDSQPYTTEPNIINITGSYETESTENPVISLLVDNEVKDTANISLTGNNFSIKFDTAGLDIKKHNIIVQATCEEETGEDYASFNVINYAPSLIATSTLGHATIGNDMEFQVDVTDRNSGQSIELFYSVDGGATYKSLGSTICTGGKVSKKINIPASEFTTAGNISIQFKVSDGIKEVLLTPTTYKVIDATPTISIIQPSDQPESNAENIVKVKGTVATESDANISVTAQFNNIEVQPTNILVNGKNFEISVDTQNLPISDDGYTLNVDATVEGKSDSGTTKIKIVNSVPTITATPASTTVNKNKSLNFQLDIEDGNPGQTLKYSYSTDGGNTFTELGTATNNGTKISKTVAIPSDVFAVKGTKNLIFAVTDNIATTKTDAISITVKDPTPVVAFASSGVPDQQYTVSDNIITITGTVTTESNTTPTIVAKVNNTVIPSENITLEGNALSIKLNTASYSVSDTPYTVSVSATAEGETGTGATTFKVVNTAPSISASSEKKVVNIGDTLPVSILMTDINAGQTLTYSYSTDGGKTYKQIGTAETGGIALTRKFDVPASVFNTEGTVTIKFKVSDGISFSETTKDIEVNVIDPTPVITLNKAVDDQQFTKNKNKVVFTGTITTKSASTPTVSAVFNGKEVPAEDIVLNGTSLSITIDTANLAVKNNYTLSVNSTVDGTSSSSSTSINVVNTKPSITAKANMTTLLVNTPLNVSLSLKDINPGQTLKYSYSTDGGATFTDFGTVESTGNTITKPVTIPASVFDTGKKYSITFRVSDGLESSDTVLNISALTPEDPTPIIEFNQESSNNEEQQFTTKENIIKFYGTVSTKSSSIPVLSAKFNGKTVSQNDISFDGKKFVISINTASLPVRAEEYVLEVTASSQGKTGSGHSSVEIVNTPSVITATAPTDTVGVNEGLDINLTITDKNPGQKVTYSYSIDGGETYTDMGTVDISDAEEVLTATGRIDSVSNVEGPVFIKIRAFDGVDYSYADKDIAINVADTTPIVKIDTSDNFNQQYTTNSNVVTFTGSFTTLSSSLPSISATFNGIDVPSSNITLEGNNFAIAVDVSNLPVSNTPYDLTVNITAGDKTGTATAPVKIGNTAATIQAVAETTTLKAGSPATIKLTLDDKNPGQTLSYSYSIDGGKTFTDIDSVVYNGNTISKIIEIPGNVFSNEGQIRLTFKVNDGVEDTITTEENDVLIDVIAADDITPIIKIDTASVIDQQVTSNDNIVIINGTVSTPSTDPLTLNVMFNGMEVSPENITLNGDTFSIKINTKGLDVNLDGYPIEISATVGIKTGFGKSALRVVNTAPTLNISKYSGKGSITVSGSVSDINVGQKVTIQYSIDDSIWKDLVVMDAGQNLTFSNTIDEILTANNKKISFRAFDGIDYSPVIDKIVDSTIIADENAIVKVNVSNAPAQIETGKSADIELNIESTDVGAAINVYRVINDGEKALIKSFASDGNPAVITDSISGLEKGSYTIKYIVESGTISNSDTLMITVTDNTVTPPNPDKPNNPDSPNNPDNPKPTPTPGDNNAPELYISDIDTDVDSGSDIEFVLKVKDEDEDQKVTVYYQIDKEKPVKIESFKSKGKTVTIEGTIPGDIVLGDHTIIFFAEDEDGDVSNADGDTKVNNLSKDKGNKITINVSSSAPILKILTFPSNVNINDKIPVSLSITDKDKGETISVYYRIDNLFPIKIASFETDGNAKTVNFDIPALTEGNHSITFFAEDSNGMRSNKNGDVNLQNAYASDKDINQMNITIVGTNTSKPSNPPMLDIITDTSNIKKNENIKITFSVLDKDKNEEVTIYYSIDGQEGKKFTSYTSNGIAKVQTIDFGKLDSTKEHKIAIWAIDASGNRSDSDMSIAAIKDENPSGGQTTISGQNPGFTTSIKTGVESSTAPRSILSSIVGLGTISIAGFSIFKKNKK